MSPIPIIASEGDAPYTFSIVANPQTLPTGLSLTTDSDGEQVTISGTPTALDGTYNFIVKAVGAEGVTTGSQPYTLIVSGNLFFIPATGSDLPNTYTGFTYSTSIQAQNGTGQYTYAVTSGVLPPGLTLTSSGTSPYPGVISGTATTVGTYTFTITASDQSNPTRTGSGQFTITVSNGNVTINPGSSTSRVTLPQGLVGTAYSQQITASPGSYTYQFTGTSPVGLSIDSSTGLITGTPSTSTLYNSFAVQATSTLDSSIIATQAYEMSVLLPLSVCQYADQSIALYCQGSAFTQLSTNTNYASIYGNFTNCPSTGPGTGIFQLPLIFPIYINDTQYDNYDVSGFDFTGCDLSLCNNATCSGPQTQTQPVVTLNE